MKFDLVSECFLLFNLFILAQRLVLQILTHVKEKNKLESAMAALWTAIHLVYLKYTAVAELGTATDTLDVKGNVVEEKKYDHITKEALEEKLKEFTGEIMQVPPLYSALKRNGKRMADLMKQGQEVEPKPARPVRVYRLSLQDFSPPLFTLELESGSGCHVRSLVDDLGKALSSCAHLKELTRIKQEGFSLEDALREDHWTFAEISQVLKPCPVSPEDESNAKKIKLE
ncbi:pseudouridylate synthase TRUB1-like isoform X2 [Triplophysa dalaica]|uniref:pseudouridylate synthase TRUB1-like isoform X2 n=1 Tax=Triplophysa dalaica TaxID=1582913 RepID=UPI0024E020CD|nr:pseudouridylate synthase TRUB1-like isoform X2 [Triplophysa dalaica]